MLSRFLSDAVLGENDSVGQKSGRHDNASDAVFFIDCFRSSFSLVFLRSLKFSTLKGV